MSIEVYQPGVSVKLLKLIARKDGVASRYAAAERDVDLTPYLGDTGVVRTLKSIYEPAGGFSVSFHDIVDQQSSDTLYALIEPMDMIEIRMARHQEDYAGQQFPLVMRGFVSTIQRVETMSQDGTPQRLVIVQGQDFGKLWKISQVWFEIAVRTELPMLTQFQLQAALGLEPRLMGIADFMTTLTTGVINPKIDKLAAFANRQIKQFQVDATVTEGQIIPQQMAGYQGDLWGLATEYADRPWNELFADYDEDENPLLVFRPTPFKDISGNLIMPGASDPGSIAMDIDAVVNLDVMRTDARVANFFWSPPGGLTLDTSFNLNVASLQSGAQLDFEYQNDSPILYGERKMEVPTRLIPTDVTTLPTKLPVNQRPNGLNSYIQWNLARADQLKAMNRDNAVWESGTALVRGDETLRIGRYLQLTRGDLTSEYYLTQVAQTFAPFRSWTANLTLERGTGFLVRNKYTGAPYWAERAGASN